MTEYPIVDLSESTVDVPFPTDTPEAEVAPVLADYSRALDEIYALRSLLAYEASVLEAHLGYKTFPKSRRVYAEAQVERMREAARGRPHSVYRVVVDKYLSMRHARREAGMSDTLTRSSWEAESRHHA